MKTIFSGILGFVLLCVIGTLVGGFLFMLYDGCTSYVIGTHFSGFSIKAFINGILICFPALLFFVPMFLYLSIIRHSSQNKVLGVVTIAVLSLGVWLFVVPVCSRIALEQNVFAEKGIPEISKGYFRKYGDSMYYFSSVNGNYVDGMKFENRFFQSSAPRSVEIMQGNYMDFRRDEYGFVDPLIGESLKPPQILSRFFLGLISIERIAFGACRTSVWVWIEFSLIMVALISCAAFISISAWRLVSASFVVFATFAILALNYLYMNSCFTSFMQTLERFGGIFVFARNNFHIVMNAAIALLFCIVGLISFLVSKLNGGAR